MAALAVDESIVGKSSKNDSNGGGIDSTTETTFHNLDSDSNGDFCFDQREAACHDGDNDTKGSSLSSSSSPSHCCDLFDGNSEAKGASWIGASRGMIVMSNIFMSSSLLYLASDAAGCFDDVPDGASPTKGSQCNNKIHGMTPSSFISNIAVIAGILSALLMPICGAIVDFTPHRRRMGIVTASVITIIQGIQIYTVSSTWFLMSILQSLVVPFYQFNVLAIYAYYPDIAREVKQEKMNRFTSNLMLVQFMAQFIFLVVVGGIQFVFKTNNVLTAQISQAINTVSCIVLFGTGWLKYMTPRPAMHKLGPNHGNIITAGFRQNWNTAKAIHRHYKKGLRWFCFALIFAESSASTIVSISIVYLNDTLKLTGSQISIFFVIALIGTMAGTQIEFQMTKRTNNPNLCWQISMVYLFLTFLIGSLSMEHLPTYCSYVWAIFVGIGLGIFYPTENLFFSLCLPPGQDAELTGFKDSCSQILAFLPPLIFTILVEFNVQQKYGLIVVASFFLIAVIILHFGTSPWNEIVEEAKSGISLIGNTIEDEVNENGLETTLSTLPPPIPPPKTRDDEEA